MGYVITFVVGVLVGGIGVEKAFTSLQNGITQVSEVIKKKIESSKNSNIEQ